MSAALRDGLKARALAAGDLIFTNAAPFYKAGEWHDSYQTGYEYSSAPIGSLLASMYRATKTAKYLAPCIETWDWAVANLFHSAGYYQGDNNRTVFDPLAITLFSCFFAQTLWTLVTMPGGNALDATRTEKWHALNKAQVEWEDYTSNLVWYSNGNWVLLNCRWLYYTKEICKALGDTAGYDRMNALYEREILFVNTPATTPVPGFPAGDPKWTGYGYTVDSAGVQPDKSDELGHYTELNGGPPMPNAGAGTSSDGIAPFGTYDGDYTGLQLDYLGAWFAASRDPRVQRAMNALLNKYLSSVTTNITTWVGNFSHGSRHNNPANGITNIALPVAALISQRLSGTPYADAFTDAKVLNNWDVMIGPNWLSTQVSPGNAPAAITRAYGNAVPAVLLACEQYVLTT